MNELVNGEEEENECLQQQGQGQQQPTAFFLTDSHCGLRSSFPSIPTAAAAASSHGNIQTSNAKRSRNCVFFQLNSSRLQKEDQCFVRNLAGKTQKCLRLHNRSHSLDGTCNELKHCFKHTETNFKLKKVSVLGCSVVSFSCPLLFTNCTHPYNTEKLSTSEFVGKFENFLCDRNVSLNAGSAPTLDAAIVTGKNKLSSRKLSVATNDECEATLHISRGASFKVYSPQDPKQISLKERIQSKILGKEYQNEPHKKLNLSSCKSVSVINDPQTAANGADRKRSSRKNSRNSKQSSTASM